MRNKKVVMLAYSFVMADLLTKLTAEMANTQKLFAVYGKVSDEFIEDHSLTKMNISNLLPKRPLVNLSPELTKHLKFVEELNDKQKEEIGLQLRVPDITAKLLTSDIERIAKTPSPFKK